MFLLFCLCVLFVAFIPYCVKKIHLNMYNNSKNVSYQNVTKQYFKQQNCEMQSLTN